VKLPQIVGHYSDGPLQLTEARLRIFDFEAIARDFSQCAVADREHDRRHEQGHQKFDQGEAIGRWSTRVRVDTRA
jgi:hypothetical protein